MLDSGRNFPKRPIPTHLVLELQKLETIKVAQVLSLCTVGELLSPCGLVPGSDGLVLFEELLDSGGTSSTGQVLDNQGSQSQATESMCLTLDTSCRSVNKGTAVVNNVDNDSELASVFTIVDEDDTADFDKALE
jgi:hypothetical protein